MAEFLRTSLSGKTIPMIMGILLAVAFAAFVAWAIIARPQDEEESENTGGLRFIDWEEEDKQ